MNLVLKRIWALFLKETLTLLKDRRGRIVLIGPPILQLVIFSFAATLEVKNISLAVYNEDTSKQAQEFINQIIGSKTFKSIFFVKNKKEVQSMIEQQIVIGAIHIPDNFSNHIKQNRSARIQVILDGRRSNAAQIVAGYLGLVTERYTQDLLKEVPNEGLPPVIVVSRHWFNENLLYTWFTVPSLVAILSMLVALIVTSLSVARERELGTFDQLLVSPLMPYEILMGKTLPAVSISLCEGLLIWTIGVLLFKLPFTGHFLVLVFFISFKKTKKKGRKVRLPGIEPGPPAWQAEIIPLDNERLLQIIHKCYVTTQG